MNPLSFLVVGTLLSSTWSLPPTGFPLQTVFCNDTDVEVAADLALQRINKEREEGNVLSLFRINAVQKQNWRRGDIFSLAFNVLDTECHVLSRKDYKECEVRELHEAVYGVCKAVVYVGQGSDVKLLSYNCTLSPVARREIASICPDCPSGDSLDKPIYTEIAKLSLSKYNLESNNSKIFAVKNITRTSMQSGFGNFYFVEFTVYQTGCTKDNLLENGVCEIVDLVTRYGYCKASKIAEDPIDSASCTIYEPEDQRKPYHRRTHWLKKKCGQGHGQEHGHRCTHGHSHEQGQKHGHGYTPGHSHGQRRTSGYSHEQGQEHGHRCTHGHRHTRDHSHKHGHSHGHRCIHDHSHEQGEEHGHRCTHGHSHGQRRTSGHSHEQGEEHGHKCTHGHSHGHGLSHGCDEVLVEESSQDHRNDSSEGHGFYAHCRRLVGSVIVLPQSTDQVDLPDPVLTIPEITWIPSAVILPFPDKSSPGCPAEPKLPQLWVLDLLKPIK
ncbi:histidine-rich glycoprotein-like [Acipenser ruthenus]|uniref:histidine-rich glycoprotein-like n=1 Tax=Acipenser ruthenus TaxID=7906 RepID=UPI00274075A7|nr:histidine-rich glycoprotein-like [Acipenser ruthenus]